MNVGLSDMRDGSVETPEVVNLLSPHLQALPLGAPAKWETRRLDIKNAFSKADGFQRDVLLTPTSRMVSEWTSSNLEIVRPRLWMEWRACEVIWYVPRPHFVFSWK